MSGILISALTGLFFISGCGVHKAINEIIQEEKQAAVAPGGEGISDYYEKFYKEVSRRAMFKEGTTEIAALDALPKDPDGNVNWTASVVMGMINPRGSLDPNVPEEPPLNLNVFIEAKVPLMANVIFPHSIHTYWLNCNTCHPKIFLPEAGANPITMDEIFKGEWCGRCHGKVAFQFWPRSNCTRCHIILKGQSLERERWR